MSRSHEILYFVGQRLLWGLQGGALVFCLGHLRASPAAASLPAAAPPAPVTVRAPDVHVHLAPTPAAVAPEPTAIAPVSASDSSDRNRALCNGVKLFNGIYTDRFRSLTYVERALVDRTLEDQSMVMRSTRIVPEQRGGHTVGIRLLGIRSPDSLMSRLGFENGDVLRAINGLDVTEPERALEAYARLRVSSEYYVLIERHGVPRMLEFRIC